jgi:hypothetical protein
VDKAGKDTAEDKDMAAADKDMVVDNTHMGYMTCSIKVNYILIK